MNKNELRKIGLITTILLMTACGGGDGVSPAETPPAETPPAETPPPAQPKSWGDALTINTEVISNTDPYIATDKDGNGFAIWSQLDSEGYGHVVVKRYEVDGGWQDEVNIETDVDYVASPKIAFDNSGNAIAVWASMDSASFPTIDRIKANIYTVGQGWGTHIQLNDVSRPLVTHPEITFAPNGDAIIYWSDEIEDVYTHYIYNVMAVYYDASQLTEVKWGKPEKVNRPAVDDYLYDQAVTPKIAFDGNGHAIAVWKQYRDTPSDGLLSPYFIYANRYETAWGDTTLNIGGQIDSLYVYPPELVVDLDGNAIVVWGESQNDRPELAGKNIWVNHFTMKQGSGVWGTAALLETNEEGDARSPKISMDTNGNAMASWVQFDTVGNKHQWSRYYKDSVWQTAEKVDDGINYLDDNFQIVSDGLGNVITVWSQLNSGRLDVYSNRYEPGAGWKTTELIETYDDESARHLGLAADSNGNAIAIWRTGETGSASSIWVNHYD